MKKTEKIESDSGHRAVLDFCKSITLNTIDDTYKIILQHWFWYTDCDLSDQLFREQLLIRK